MNKIEHIGIAVSSLQTAQNIYEKLLNTAVYKIEEVPSEHVRTAFLQSGPNKIELLEAASSDSAIAKFIEKKGEGIHHIAFEVDDIRSEMERLKSEGFILLNDEPKKGADNKLVCFVHPKSANGVLVELCESFDFPSKAKQRPLDIAEKLNLFEFRHQLVLPDDLKAYFRLTDDEIKAYEKDMFLFYKYDEFKSVKEDVGDFGGIPDYRKIIHTLSHHEDCFVFVNYMITSIVYAIRLYKHKSDINEVYAISGNQFEVVASSFTEFMSIYQEDYGKLFF